MDNTTNPSTPNPAGQIRLLEAGQGKPLLLIPGWNTAAESSLDWTPGFFQEKHRCHFLPWPGYGSAWDEELPPDLESWMDRLAAHLPEEPIPVVGFCLGGVAAWALAQRHPHRISQVVMVESPVHLPLILAPLLLPGLGKASLSLAARTRWGQWLVERAILLPRTDYPRSFLDSLFRFDLSVALHYVRIFNHYRGSLPESPSSPVPCVRILGDQAPRILDWSWGSPKRIQARLHPIESGHFPAVESSEFWTLLDVLVETRFETEGSTTEPGDHMEIFKD